MEGSDQAGARYRPSEPMEGSNQAGARHGPFGWSGALTRSGSREFKGQPRDARAICSVQPRPAFSSVSRQNPNKRAWWNTRPQPQAPNLLGATGTGPPTGHVSIGIVGKGQTKAGARHGPLGPMEGSNEDWRAASSVGVDGRGQTGL